MGCAKAQPILFGVDKLMFSGVRGGGRFLKKAPQKLSWKSILEIDCL